MKNKIIIFLIIGILIVSAVAADRKIHLRSRERSPSKHIRLAQSAERRSFSDEGRKYVILQLDHIPDKREKKELARKGVKLLDYIPDYAWFASVKSTDINIEGMTYISEWTKEDKMLFSEDAKKWKSSDKVRLKGSLFSDDDGMLSRYSDDYKSCPLY
jgi:hypothetical protein